MWALIKWWIGDPEPNNYVEASIANPFPVQLVGTAQSASDFANEGTNDTVTLVTGSGSLVSVQVNIAGVTSDITLYDSLTGSGTVIAVIDTTTTGLYQYNAAFSTGLTYVTTGGTPANVTIMYR